jgi:hypothetical protein
MILFHLLLKTLLLIPAIIMWSIDMRNVQPGQLVIDPTMADPSIPKYFQFASQMFNSRWFWLVNAFLPDDSVKTGFPMPIISTAGLPGNVISWLTGAVMQAPTPAVKPTGVVTSGPVTPTVPAITAVASALGLPSTVAGQIPVTTMAP